MQRKVETYKYSSVKPKEISWLWYPYIARGKITLLQGDPGEGKSTFAIEVASLLSRGTRMPNSTVDYEPVNVIYQCGEDGLEDTIRPRMDKAKGDLNRLIYIRDDGDLNFTDVKIKEAIQQNKAGLMIFDPIQAYLPPNCDMANAVSMRLLLKRLAQVAEDTKCAIVLVGHMNKDTTSKKLYRGLGSIDIAAVARSILLIQRDEADASIRHVYQIKNNIAPEGPPISFTIAEGQEFQWSSSGSPVKPEMKKPAAAANPVDRATVALELMLEGNDVRASELYKHLGQLGISESTARRALKAMGAQSKKKGAYWFWTLPDDR